MSTFNCPIVRIKDIQPVPNSDHLSMTKVDGVTAIFKTTDFKVGDLAVYIPEQAVVPLSRDEFSWLKKPEKPDQTHHRVKAVRLRGVYSEGFFVPFEAASIPLVPLIGFLWSLAISFFRFIFSQTDGGHFKWSDLLVGLDMAKALGVAKYEEPEEPERPTVSTRGRQARDPGFMPVYDMENFRKFHHRFEPGEPVVMTEKIHGCNARFCYRNGQFHIGSHKVMKQDDGNVWSAVAQQYRLPEKLAQFPGLAFYGEVYGQVQDLKYGTKPGEVLLAFFDIYDTRDKRWLDYDEAVAILDLLNLPRVPVLYQGPYDHDKLLALASGDSTIAKHIKEGGVVRTRKERSGGRGLGRMVLKIVSEAYKLRKGGTERH